jgi:hypothetical protein
MLIYFLRMDTYKENAGSKTLHSLILLLADTRIPQDGLIVGVCSLHLSKHW